MGVMVTLYGYQEWQQSRQLAAEGESTIARVKHHYDYKPRKGSRRYYLVVAFETENKQAQSQTVSVNSAVYDAAVASGTVTVHYLPSKPSLLQAGSNVEIKYGGFVGGLVMIGLAAGLWLIYSVTTRSIAKGVGVLCEAQLHRRRVDAQKFKRLDLSFYDYGRRELEAHGFVFLEDTEISTAKGIFIRWLVGPDGATVAALYHCKLPAWARLLGAKESKVVDFETGFGDGYFAITSNAESAGKLDYPEVLDSTFLAEGTALPLVLHAHERHLSAFREKHPGAELTPIKTVEDLYRFQSEMDRIKAEHRQRTGLTKAELQRIAGTDGGEAMNILHQDVAKQHQKRNEKAA